MNNKCINLSQKLNRKLYCKKLKKEIFISQCSNCRYKSIVQKNNKNWNIKSAVSLHKTLQSAELKKKTSKLAKLERNRFSILTNDLDHCIICGNKKEHLHEVIYGRNRLNSIKYGLVIPLCSHCHIKIHNDIELDLDYKKIAQKRFMTYYNKDINKFIKIFKRNYL